MPKILLYYIQLDHLAVCLNCLFPNEEDAELARCETVGISSICAGIAGLITAQKTMNTLLNIKDESNILTLINTTDFSMNNNSDEPEDEMSLYNFKLVGIISGQYESYISLVDSSGKAIVIQLNEELKEGLKLVDLRLKEAIFQKEDETYMIIDFNNQIREADEY